MMFQNKIRGCLLGGAIGDSLGYQIEFDRNIQEKQVTRFKDDIGIISDDTQMTLFTANALLWQNTRLKEKGIAPSVAESVYYGYLDWYDTQKRNSGKGPVSFIKEIWLKTQRGNKNREQISWLMNIPELYYRRAPGNTCLHSLRSGRRGTLENPINNSKGCGGVMRIAPCGIANNIPHMSGKFAAECSAITHGHQLGSISSYMCAAMISMLIHSDITIENAVIKSLKLTKENQDIFKNKLSPNAESNMNVFVAAIEKAIELSGSGMLDTAAIRQLGDGFVAEEALAIAIYSCLKYPNSFEDAIVCAVNHDGDSDSTGAIAGNIIGATLGIATIPSYYVDNVELKDVILEIADDMVKIKDKSFDMYQDENWIRKYLNI